MNPIIPFSAIVIYTLILLWISFNIIPDPLLLVEYIQAIDRDIIYLSLFSIILLESIVYVWFYFPGQFIAVLVVTSYASKIQDIFILTLISIIAVTISAAINYYLGFYLFKTDSNSNKVDIKKLLISMIHINTLALYTFDQWTKKWPKKLIYLIWLLNLPYYLLILFITFLLKQQVITISENIYFLYVILFLWFGYSIYLAKQKNNS